jgi:hypothetical protein
MGAAHVIAVPKGVGNLAVVLKGADRIVGLTDLPPEVHVDLVDLTVVRDGDLDRTDVTGDRGAAQALVEGDLDLEDPADRVVDQEWGGPVARGTLRPGSTRSTGSSTRSCAASRN